MPIGYGVGFEFAYFTKSQKFTKAHLLQYFENDQELLQYIPDDIDKNSINRNYLISVSIYLLNKKVLACTRKEIYLSLYNEYKSIIANKNINKWNNYSMSIKSDMAKKINSFSGTEK